ncbi:MAG: DUF4956 domain-containing protein [Patescibacteria group bacterium]
MNQNFLTNFYNLTQTELSATVIVFNILFSFTLAYGVVWVWRKTHKGLSYSQSFAVTLVMIAPLASAVMMIVQNNLIGAFALLGAFSLIRFRTIMKETRDIAFLFFALTIGVSVGTGYYSVSILTTGIVSSLILILYRYNFASASGTGFLLTFHSSTALDANTIELLFGEFLKSHALLHEKASADGLEFAYSLHFKKEGLERAFVDRIRSIASVTDAFLLTGKDSIEY